MTTAPPVTTIKPRPGTMDADVITEMSRNVYGLEGRLRSDAWVIDIGAYVGTFAEYVLNNCPDARVLSAEPMPRNFEALVENLGSRVVTVNRAIARESGMVTLHDFGDDASACHSMYDLGVADAKPIRVPSSTLAELIDEFALDEIQVLKLDCQGAEFDIVTSTSVEVLGRIDYVAMEVHDAIAKTGKQLGRVPNFRRQRAAMLEHLRQTHVPLTRDIRLGSIQLWGNRRLAAAEFVLTDVARRCVEAGADIIEAVRWRLPGG